MNPVPQPLQNLLLQPIEYKIEETERGTWRRFVYPTGQLFAEYISHRQMFGLPLVHYTYGRCPETGRRVVAKGVLAVGRLACGVVAVGQASLGIVAIGQAAFGILLGLGQFSMGALAVGQVALAVAFGVGQVAIGHVAIGQAAWGKYVLAQFGLGQYVWDMRGAAPEAFTFFRSLIGK